MGIRFLQVKRKKVLSIPQSKTLNNFEHVIKRITHHWIYYEKKSPYPREMEENTKQHIKPKRLVLEKGKQSLQNILVKQSQLAKYC